MRSGLIVLLAGLLYSQIFAQQVIEEFFFRNPNNIWQKDQGQISKLEYKTTTEGLFARTQMTVTIKDTLATIWVDTMEAVMNFSLPQKSVVDSMYLWIDGKPEPAFMKKAWAATMIFENIVNRRQDPALLKKNGSTDLYTINIYPVKKGIERTFRVCYTTPLEESGNLFGAEIPFSIAKLSRFPVRGITASVQVLGCVDSSITVEGCSSAKVTIKKEMTGKTVVAFTDVNCVYDKPLKVSMENGLFSSKGILVDMVRDSAQNWFFAARLSPEKMLGINQATKRKTVIIWNMVQLSQVQYDPGNNKYYYNYAYNYNWYIDQSRKELAAFIRQTLHPGDQLNLVINDGTVSALFPALTPVTAQTFSAVDRFIADSISSMSVSFGCTTPLEVLQKGIVSCAGNDSVMIILVDNMQHSYVSGQFDTTLVRQQLESLKPLIPAHTTMYVSIVPQSQNIINTTYTGITALTAGQIFSVNASTSLQPTLQAITLSMAGKIYPHNLVFTSPSIRYPYDVIGNEADILEVGKSYLYTGRLTASDKLTISLKGTYNQTAYSFDSTCSASDSNSIVTGLSDFWAAEKVKLILAKQPNAFDNRQALNISLNYRIVSPLTALLALEKRIADSLKIKDDKPTTGDTLVIQQNGGITTPIIQLPMMQSFSSTLGVFHTGSQLVLTLPLGISSKVSALRKQVEIKLFDLRGKCVVDLSKNSYDANGRMVFNTKNLAKGFYCVRVVIGDVLFMKSFSIVK